MDEVFSLYTLIRGFDETCERFEISKENLGKILHPPGSFLRVFFSRVLECMQEMILASSISDASEYFSIPKDFIEVLFDPVAEFQYVENTKFMIESFNNTARSNAINTGGSNSTLLQDPPIRGVLDADLLLLATNRRNDYLIEKNMVFKPNLTIPIVARTLQPAPNQLPNSLPNENILFVHRPHLNLFSPPAPEARILPVPELAPNPSVNQENNIPATRSLNAPIIPITGRVKKISINSLQSHRPLSGDILNPDYSLPDGPSSN